MKRNNPNSGTGTDTGTSPENTSEEWTQGDPLWDLLSNASEREPDPFFARNIVRKTRLQQNTREPVGSRLRRLLTPRLVSLGAAACACALIGYQVWQPANTSPQPGTPPTMAQVNQTPDSSSTMTELSDILIEETLLAAADDPSLFTRDEVATMLGL